MATNRKQGHKVIRSERREDASGLRMDAGPFIGVVKHVLDPTHSGRLQVYLPHLGGDPENPNNQKIVQYASPFSGHTSYQENAATKIANTGSGFETVRHHYGMWFTPPDVGVRVLVIFEASNANNGYWIACLPPPVEHNQVGGAGGIKRDQILSDPQTDALIEGYDAAYAPGVDINGADQRAQANSQILNAKKTPHRIQTKILAEQGLLGDPNRGIDNSSTTRETPTGAYGITTPGRTYVDQATDDLLQRVTEAPNVDTTKIKEKVVNGRKGGHQFIMDDGDVNGNSRRFKLRSAAGHQIIMDDTNGFMYISTSTGKNWIELTNDGQMFVYASNDINIRTQRNLNLKVDGDFNTEVDGNYNLNVRGNTKTETVNREEVVTGNKLVDIGAEYSTNVAGDIFIGTEQSYNVSTGVDIAFDSGIDFGVTAGGEMAFDSALDSGWNVGGDLDFQAVAIGLNTSAPPSPITVTAPTVPSPFVVADLFDTIKIGDIWKHGVTSTATGQTILPQIPTHEPYASGLVTPLVSATGKPSKGI